MSSPTMTRTKVTKMRERARLTTVGSAVPIRSCSRSATHGSVKAPIPMPSMVIAICQPAT